MDQQRGLEFLLYIDTWSKVYLQYCLQYIYIFTIEDNYFIMIIIVMS